METKRWRELQRRRVESWSSVGRARKVVGIVLWWAVYEMACESTLYCSEVQSG